MRPRSASIHNNLVNTEMQNATVTAHKKRRGQRSHRELEDDSIIGTNDYSIVSKRSVEKLYFHDEPDFLRPFVAKHRRRTPLINRGYWLRVRAINFVVKQFLDLPCAQGEAKAIVNLGCGYDTLPFRTRYLYPEQSKDVLFIDLDYLKLMQRKLAILGKLKQDDLLFGKQNYFAEGCDLRDLITLEEILDEILPDPNCHIMFIAEVSITYMDMEATNDLLAWIPRYKNAHFCLHEQIMPDGPAHPFAQTMLAHYDNAGTPLKSIHEYPTLSAQRQRFLGAGWKTVEARDMWSIWQDDAIVPVDDRLMLDKVEQFDEWEEFALHSSHYVLLTASMQQPLCTSKAKSRACTHSHPEYSLQPLCKASGSRRFGAAYCKDDRIVAHFGGMTSNCPSNQEVLVRDLNEPSPPAIPQDLSCQTATELGNEAILVTGGRSSPSKASSKCWVLAADSWQQVADLPSARFRHSVVHLKLGNQDLALSFGGKESDGKVLDEWLLFSSESGWTRLQHTGDAPRGRFGAVLCAHNNDSGLLIGGMSQDGVIVQECWQWQLHLEDVPRLTFVDKTSDLQGCPHIFRFGATMCNLYDELALIGGVSAEGTIPTSSVVQLVDKSYTVSSIASTDDASNQPLLVGHSTVALRDGGVIILGGGAVCFSFGFCSNDKVNLLSNPSDHASRDWQPKPIASEREQSTKDARLSAKSHSMLTKPLESLEHVEEVAFQSTDEDRLLAIVSGCKPVIMKDLAIGICRSTWTTEYLEAKLGSDRQIIVHAATSPNLSFNSKNFTYRTTTVADFLESACNGDHVYLRSVSSSSPGKTPASLVDDFPNIAQDFSIPEILRAKINPETIHSSVLRISGDINMWLHYDVMANILCQVKGSKRVILFPPSDVSLLGFPPGETTASLQVFGEGHSTHLQVPVGSHPVEAVLNSGDVLYIPACWPHATAIAPRTKQDLDVNGVQDTECGGDKTRATSISVAVNVFFRGFDSTTYAAGRDVYGNRDVAAYENGRRDLTKLIHLLKDTTLTRSSGPEDPATVKTSRQASVAAESLDTPVSDRLDLTATFIATGEKTIRLDDKVFRIADRIRRGFRHLPDDVRGFYLQRLSDELKSSMIS